MGNFIYSLLLTTSFYLKYEVFFKATNKIPEGIYELSCVGQSLRTKSSQIAFSAKADFNKMVISDFELEYPADSFEVGMLYPGNKEVLSFVKNGYDYQSKSVDFDDVNYGIRFNKKLNKIVIESNVLNSSKWFIEDSICPKDCEFYQSQSFEDSFPVVYSECSLLKVK